MDRHRIPPVHRVGLGNLVAADGLRPPLNARSFDRPRC